MKNYSDNTAYSIMHTLNLQFNPQGLIIFTQVQIKTRNQLNLLIWMGKLTRV